MKKSIFILALTICCQLANAAKPVEIEIDQIVYRLDLDAMTASVFDSKEDIKTANIVSEVIYQDKTYPVTTIGGASFYQRHSLQSVIIPNSITSIGSRAFQSCWNLKNIEIPNSVKIIEASAFEMCI